MSKIDICLIEHFSDSICMNEIYLTFVFQTRAPDYYVWNSSAHIVQVGKMSVSGYTDRRFESRQHLYVVSMNKTLYPHCFSHLRCEVSTRRKHPREGCLFSAMSFSEEIALSNQRFFLFDKPFFSTFYVIRDSLGSSYINCYIHLAILKHPRSAA